MERIIIGIHGLGNKPAAAVLHRWWRKSLHEGFRAIGHPRRRLPFETVYWADILHRIPYDPAIRDRGDERFLEEPYRPSPGAPIPVSRPVRKKILDLVEKQIMRLDPDEGSSLLWKQLNDLVLRRFFAELEAYYTNSLEIAPGAALAYRDIVRTRLADKLREHSGKEILLIAHSMGSIIAYDVLSSAPPGMQVHTLITIGSPLGMPLIMHNIRLEQKLATGEKLAAPASITRGWYNLADLADKVALNYHLANDFVPNPAGVGVTDIEVYNDYAVDGDPNPHKDYGYLRTPELARICFEFISAGESPAAIRRKDALYRVWEWGSRLFSSR